MEMRSEFVIEQLDADGNPLGAPYTVDSGRENRRTDQDPFFARRMRAIRALWRKMQVQNKKDFMALAR